MTKSPLKLIWLTSLVVLVLASEATPVWSQTNNTGTSLPPRWGAVRNGQSSGSFSQMPSSGGLSSLEGLSNAMGQWLQQAQSAGSMVPVPGANGVNLGPLNPPPGTSSPGSGPNAPATGSAERGLRVTKGSGVLPNDRGQVWREYDITPYTSRVTKTNKPEQSILDWVLRETGPDLWFSQPLGILNADSRTLRVYHTPEIQEIVRSVVERFVDSNAQDHAIGLKLVTIGTPSWRARVLPLLTPVDIQSPGVEAWLISKENASLMVNELRQRADYRELQVPNFYVTNGFTQSFGRTRARSYVRSVRLRNDVWPGYELVNGQLQEGFQLDVSPLVSADGKVCDVAIKCNIDEVEKMIPVAVDVPAAGSVQRVELQIPQVVSWRLQERFRWPADQVLLLSCGVVISPDAQPAAGNLSLPFFQGANRADALLLVENWGKSAAQLLSPQVNPSVTVLPGVPGAPTVPGAVRR